MTHRNIVVRAGPSTSREGETQINTRLTLESSCMNSIDYVSYRWTSLVFDCLGVELCVRGSVGAFVACTIARREDKEDKGVTGGTSRLRWVR